MFMNGSAILIYFIEGGGTVISSLFLNGIVFS